MNFKVCFKTEDGSPGVKNISRPGLNLLDYFRKAYPMYADIPIKDLIFKHECSFTSNIFYIDIPEVYARSSGLFKETDCINVVFDGDFSRFVHLRVKEHKCAMYTEKKLFKFINVLTTEYYTKLEIVQRLNTKEILEEWKKAGFPEFWVL